MNFKVGQRVRVVDPNNETAERIIGLEGEIVSFLRDWPGYGPVYLVSLPAVPRRRGPHWEVPSRNLVPLTDPDAEKLIESLNKQMSAPVGPVIPVKVPA